MSRLRDAWPVIVIVATISGAAWMAAWNVQRFIAAEIAESEARLTARIAETQAETRSQIAENRAQIAETRAETRSQIAELQAQIAEIRQYIVDHLADHAELD